MNKAKNPTGAGAIIALLIMTGAIGGGLLGQPSIGLLVGTGAGIPESVFYSAHDMWKTQEQEARYRVVGPGGGGWIKH